MVLIDDHGDDVRTAGRTVIEEANAEETAGKQTSDDDRHERVCKQRNGRDRNHFEPNREPHHAPNRAQGIALAYVIATHDQQQDVDQRAGEPNRHIGVCGEIDDLAQTGHSASNDSVRYQ